MVTAGPYYSLALFVALAMLMLALADQMLGRSARACPRCGTRTGNHHESCPWSRRAQ